MSNAVIDAETESKAWNLLQSVVMIHFSENKFKKRPEAREGENFIKSIDSVLRPTKMAPTRVFQSQKVANHYCSTLFIVGTNKDTL